MSDPNVDAPPLASPSRLVLDYGRAERWDYQRACRTAALGVGLLGLVVAVIYRFTYSRTVWSTEPAAVMLVFGTLFVILRMVGTERPWMLLWKMPVFLGLGLGLLVFAVLWIDGSDLWFSRWSYGHEIVIRQRGMVGVAGVAFLLLAWLWWRERGRP